MNNDLFTAALCFDGVEDSALVASAASHLRAYGRVEAWCAYGETAERAFQEAAHRHRAPHPHPPHRQSLDLEQANAIAHRGVLLLREAGITATARTLEGPDAGHALAASSQPCIVLFLGTGHNRESGPKSIGHVARFVLDHASGPVMLLRLRA